MLSLYVALSAPLSAMAQDMPLDDAAFVAATKTLESPLGRLSKHPVLRADMIKMVGYACGKSDCNVGQMTASSAIKRLSAAQSSALDCETVSLSSSCTAATSWLDEE